MIEFMNNRDMCLICMKAPEQDYELIKHHVTYFPEKIAFVHYDCHKKIHDTPLNYLIQYDDGDARKFYDARRNPPMKGVKKY